MQSDCRRIGLIGGLGLRAGLYYYRRLADQAQRSGDALHLTLEHADLKRVLHAVATNDDEGLVCIVDLFSALRAELQARGAVRIALFGTRYVMESNLFGSLGDRDVVQAAPQELSEIHEAYLRVADGDADLPALTKRLEDIGTMLYRREGWMRSCWRGRMGSRSR